MTTTTEGGQLELVPERSGLRHYLAGRPVHAGDGLELQLEGGVWVPARYEWSGEGAAPKLFIGIAGGGVISFAIPPSALLRWPRARA